MADESSIEIINKYGWRKDFIIEKPIVLIGRDDRNDIVLNDGLESSVDARHAQMVPSTTGNQGMRLINLSTSDIVVTPKSGQNGPVTLPVAPRAAAEIGNGDQIKMGEFTLVYHGGEQRSEVKRLSIDMPSTDLTLDQPLTGTLTIHYLGAKPAVQFKIELVGLDSDCYEIGPGPVLFPDAEKGVAFRLFHPKRPKPPAGEHRITFRVTAPAAYPGESATISKEIMIAPYFQHRTRVVVMDSVDYRLD